MPPSGGMATGMEWNGVYSVYIYICIHKISGPSSQVVGLAVEDYADDSNFDDSDEVRAWLVCSAYAYVYMYVCIHIYIYIYIYI